ncbi:MAG: hypothetical protein GOMPHAMPRED_007844 [Gomphillus americanus]|uniref:DUF7924 domain-containing protein n=1 Tax=Gomphillus americanus TaxID=1940652 RepID=A0A8H3F2Q3_9LECA|nr:MAG: hypothetical protein GOMPHAMPRED_007844 [Gomphillus americanus]
MFPLIKRGISYGGNAQFSSQPLPNVPDAFCELAIPQPDRFYGYTTGPFGGFSKKENMVLSHPSMIRYAMPTVDGAFPFLIFELKSPAKGGTLWHADNQAAGSGAHCVSSMRYLMQQANGEDAAVPSTKALAFTVCVDGRYVEFNIHWYSEGTEEYMMSCIDSFRTVQEKDIQECRNWIKNIIEYCLGQCRTEIVNALETLHPFPPTWSNKKPRTRGGSSTPATSFTTTSGNK